MRIEIRSGDPQWELDGGQKRRAEFSWKPWQFASNKEGWVGAAFFLSENPMKTVMGCSIFQLHNHPDAGELMQIICFDGRSKVACDGPGHDTIILDIPLFPYLDRWTTLVVNFKPSSQRQGFIKIWLDDVRVLYFKDQKIKPSGTRGPSFKQGTYFWGFGKFASGSSNDRYPADRRAVVNCDRLAIGNDTSNSETVDPLNVA